MMYLKIITLLVLSSMSCSFAANILAIIPTPSYSHQTAFSAIWKELSLRGHSVTLVTTDPLNDPNLTNLTEIDVKWSYKYMADFTKKVSGLKKLSMWNTAEKIAEVTNPIVKEQLSFSPIQQLIQNKSEKFDVVIVEHRYPEYLGFADIHNCPKILVSSLDTWGNFHSAVGNPNHPILYPEMGSPYHGQLAFKDRVMSTLYSWHVWRFYRQEGLPDKEKTLHEYFNTTVPISSLLKDVDLLILNVNPVIQGVRVVGPTTINIGGYRPSVTSSPTLPKELQDFLDGAKEGFIYFSLGSNVKSKELGQQTINSIVNTLKELPYKVLWKFEADSLPGKPENVKLVKWAPQLSVLAHPNIKLFVTQGGLQSMEEGIYNEVPFVVIPFFGDQEKNAAVMTSKGIAKIVSKNSFGQKEILTNAILEVIQNPRYKEAVQRIKRLSLDFPINGLELGIWWIEHVIRNNGTKHLRNPLIDLPMYQYYLLDVIGFLALVLVLSVVFLIIAVKFLVDLLRHIGASKLKEQ